MVSFSISVRTVAMLRAGQGVGLPPLQQRAPARSHHKSELRMEGLAPRERSQKIIAELGKMWKALSQQDRDDWKERARPSSKEK